MLRIHTFGGLNITLNGKPISFSSRRSQLFIVYLALTGQPHQRETLATMLWDDRTQKQSLRNLRSLLAQLPKSVKPFLDIQRHSLSMRKQSPSGEEPGIWVDAQQFMRQISGQLNPRLDGPPLDYDGDFLSGVFVSESRGLEEWTAVTREHLRQLALDHYHRRAAGALYQRRYAEGLPLARRLVWLDPLRETSHRLLLRLQARAGEFNAALAQYNALTELLAAELGVEPAAETTQLLTRIKAARRRRPLHLTPHLTPFVGREAEIAQVTRLLDEPSCRLLTLMGPGGAGKTRLALTVLETVSRDYLHGGAVVPLASVQRPEEMAATIAEQIGCPLIARQPVLDQLLNYLAPREMLLVLDNIEHLLPDAVPVMQALLRQPHLTLLVTSRERLRLSVEQVVAVAGLTAVSTQSDAVALFLRCARRRDPDFAAPTDDVLTLCQLVDGLPLGIELLAAATRQQSLAQISATLQQGLAEMASDLHDTPPRHQTLAAVFDYSWALLSPETQTALQRLAVFQGGFDRRMAAQVAGVNGRLLDQLRDQSMIYLAAEQRLGILTVLQQYLRQRHPLHDPAMPQAHARYFATWLKTAVFAEISENLPNLRAMWQWAVKHDPALLAEALPEFARYATNHGPFADFAQLLAETLAALPRKDLSQIWERIALWLVEMYRLLSNHDAAERLITQIQPVSSAHEGWLERQLGLLAIGNGRFDEAITRLNRAIELAQRDDDDVTAGAALRALGVIRAQRGAATEAQTLFAQALAHFETANDLTGISQTLNNLGIVCKNLNQHDAARAHYARAYQFFQRQGDRLGESKLLNNLGVIARTQQDFAAANDYFSRALALKRELGERQGEVLALNNLGIVSSRQGELEAAESYLKEALALTQEQQERRHEGMVLSNLGLLKRLQGELETAVDLCQQAHDIAAAQGDRQTMAYALLHAGQALTAQGTWEPAVVQLQQAIALRNEMNQPYLLAEARAHYAFALWEMGHGQDAATEARAIQPFLTDSGLQTVEFPARVREIYHMISPLDQEAPRGDGRS